MLKVHVEVNFAGNAYTQVDMFEISGDLSIGNWPEKLIS